MNSKIESAFFFQQYIIKKSIFEINEAFEPVENVELEFNFKTDFQVNDTSDMAAVILSCEIFQDYKEKNLPFYLFTEIIGNFELRGDFTTEDTRSFCKFNATAILFPYLRAYISNMTSMAGVPTLILPTVNVPKLFE